MKSIPSRLNNPKEVPAEDAGVSAPGDKMRNLTSMAILRVKVGETEIISFSPDSPPLVYPFCPALAPSLCDSRTRLFTNTDYRLFFTKNYIRSSHPETLIRKTTFSRIRSGIPNVKYHF